MVPLYVAKFSSFPSVLALKIPYLTGMGGGTKCPDPFGIAIAVFFVGNVFCFVFI